MPDWKPDIRARLSAVRLAPAREAEIVEELSQHLDDRWRELVVGGATVDEAARVTLAEFRDRDLLARYLAPLRQAHWADPVPQPTRRRFVFGGLRTDLRDAVRSLRSSPGFTTAALLVLALGIGATTALFSIADAVALRALPFEDADRLVAVGEPEGPVSYGLTQPGAAMFGAANMRALRQTEPQNYLDWLAEQQAFEAMAATSRGSLTLLAPSSAPEAVDVQAVTASFFDVLRVLPARGRPFTSEHEVDGRNRVAILSDALWRRRFDSRPDIIGQTIALEGQPYEVLGVMPADFVSPLATTLPLATAAQVDLWVPYVVPPNERVRGRDSNAYLQVIARVRTGVTIARADADMHRVAVALERANPEWNRGVDAGVRPLRDHLIGASTRSWMLMLLTAVGIVLLIACANVANLLMARATVRQREVAVRAALGAGRWRLIRQFLVESLLLSTCGGGLALVLAGSTIQVLRRAMPQDIPRVAMIGLDLRVLAAAGGMAILTGIVCGVVPAWQSSTPNVSAALNEIARAGRGRRTRFGLRQTLVATELALAVVLVVGSTLFINSFIRVMHLDPGFNPSGVLTTWLFQSALPGQARADLTGTFNEIANRLTEKPHVVAAAASSGMPLGFSSWVSRMALPGRAVEGDVSVSIKLVTPGYFKTLGIAVRQGRVFTPADTSPNMAIVNESAAHRFFPGADPIGQTAILDRQDRVILGVVSDARQTSFEATPMPEAYLQWLPGETRITSSGQVTVRVDGNPYQLLPTMRSIVLEVLPNMPLRFVTTLDEQVARQMARRRVTMMILGLFGALGLVIATVGVYGVMAYLVLQRTREIGIRMALGATRANVVRLIVSHAGLLIGIGVVLGGAGAWVLSGAIRSFLYGVESIDATAFIVAASTLSVAALLACVIPARRAAGVEPTVALRSE